MRTPFSISIVVALGLLLTAGPLAAADSKIIAPGGRLEKLAGNFDFTEGPATDMHGNVFFTDQLYPRPYWKRDPAMKQDGQHVYFLGADRKNLKRVAADLKQPNGIIGTPDDKTLYVADIGAGKTYAYDIQPDGSLTNKRLFCELGSDGMTLDDEGNVYLTGRGVTVFDKAGKRIEHIDVPEPWTANITFGGKDRHLLFITASKSVYGLKMRVRGAL